MKQLRINAPEGDIYRAQGFRLPTEAEWEYVLRNLGNAKGEYPHGISEDELPDYSGHQTNSGKRTHAVGTTAKSFRVDGKALHDLQGNVSKWNHDCWNADLTGGIDPIGAMTDFLRMSNGGAWNVPLWGLKTACRNTGHPASRVDSLGLRLVRTLE